MTLDIPVYDAFTTMPGRGNPAGVVTDASFLSESEMQQIAAALGYNETAFVLPSAVADVRIRYFTPGYEVPMCGHATIASVYALYKEGRLRSGRVTIETGSGVLPIGIAPDEPVMISMTQSTYSEKPFGGSLEALADAIGLTAGDLDPVLPVVYACTGLWTLLVPVKKLESFARMTPHTKDFPSVLTEMPRASVHPFCLETLRPECRMHSRHFSSPFAGTVEDAVTGTASGAMGMYYKKHLRPDGGAFSLTLEQGSEMQKDGTVTVSVPESFSEPVTISGTAVFSKTVRLP